MGTKIDENWANVTEYTLFMHLFCKLRLSGEGDQINLIDLRFERWQIVGFSEAR